MINLITKFVGVILFVIIFYPITTWSKDWKDLEKEIDDPCFNIDCKITNEFLVRIKKAIKGKDKNLVADFMLYPLKINVEEENKKFSYEIEDKEEFIKKYDYVFTEKVKNSILNSDVKDIIANYKGIGIANGILWGVPDSYPITIFVVNITKEKNK